MTPTTTELPCPACAAAGSPGRIGNRRADCHACNRFASAVTRATARRMRRAYPDAYDRIHAEVEHEVYYRTTVGTEAER